MTIKVSGCTMPNPIITTGMVLSGESSCLTAYTITLSAATARRITPDPVVLPYCGSVFQPPGGAFIRWTTLPYKTTEMAISVVQFSGYQFPGRPIKLIAESNDPVISI